jgi:hypothetical protein
MRLVVSRQPPCSLRLNCSGSVSAAVPIPKRGAEPQPTISMNNTAWKAFRQRVAGAWVTQHGESAAEGFRNSRLLLKHTFGRKLRTADVSFEDHQDLIGHRSGRSNEHYSESDSRIWRTLVEASEKACDSGSRKNSRNRMNSSRSTENSPLDNFGRARDLAFPGLLDTLAST